MSINRPVWSPPTNKFSVGTLRTEFARESITARHLQDATFSGNPIQPASYGLGFNSKGASAYAVKPANITLDYPLWIFASFQRTAAAPASNQIIAALGENASLGAFLTLETIAGSNKGLNCRFRFVASGTIAELASGSAFPDVGQYNVIAVLPSEVRNGWYMYTNGVLDTITAASFTVSTPATATKNAVCALVRNSASGNLQNTHTVFATAHGRTMNHALARAISIDPERYLMQPVWQRILVPSAAAGGVPTLSASTYVSGSLTSTGWRPQVTAS